MLKKRLIFTLLVENGLFQLSRNFFLQSVGDLKWIKENYDFNSISASIDELIVINVGEAQYDVKKFSKTLLEISRGCFVPITAGGGIRTMNDANCILRSGADKLILNTSLLEDPDFVSSIVEKYGSQCVVASIDYRSKNEGALTETFVHNGKVSTGLTIDKAVHLAELLKVGEIFLTSINLDGTGMGYDKQIIKKIVSKTKIPVIPSGGAGNATHFMDAIQQCNVMAVATANLFNFMCGGLQEARSMMIKSGLNFAEWKVNNSQD